VDLIRVCWTLPNFSASTGIQHILTEVFRDFPQYLQAIFRVLTRPLPFPFCMYVWGWATETSPCTATFEDLLCFPFWLTPYQPYTSNEVQDLIYGGVIVVPLPS
jgi:hypothetical protein